MFLPFPAFAEGAEAHFSIPSIIDVYYPPSFEVQQDFEREAKLKEMMPLLVRKRGQESFPVYDDVLLLVLKHANDKTTRIAFGVSPPVLSEHDFVSASQESIAQLVSVLSEQQATSDRQNGITVLEPQTGQRVTLPSGNAVLLTERKIKTRNGPDKNEQKYFCFTDRFLGIVDVSTSSKSSPQVLNDIEQVTSKMRFVSAGNKFTGLIGNRYGAFQYGFMRASENSFLFLLFGASIMVSIIAALLHNLHFRRRHHSAPSYFYGYTVGYYLVAWPICLAINQYVTENASVLGMLGYYLVCAIMFSIAGVFCIKRYALGFIFGSILTLNPIFWIVSIVYAFTGAKKVWPRKQLSPPPLPPVVEPRFIVHDGTTQHEPMEKHKILDAINQGLLTQSHFYWNEQTQEWQLLSELTK